MICPPCTAAGSLINLEGIRLGFNKVQVAAITSALTTVNFDYRIDKNADRKFNWWDFLDLTLWKGERSLLLEQLHNMCESPATCTCQHGHYLEMDPNADGFQGYLDMLPEDDPRRLAYEERIKRKLPPADIHHQVQSAPISP